MIPSFLKKREEHLQKLLGPHLKQYTLQRDELTLYVEPQHLLPVLKVLKEDPECLLTQLIDVCGIDYLGEVPRFCVAYHLLSLEHNWRLRIKVPVAQEQSIPSAVSLFRCADWWERETFDLFGIAFDGHPDLRRILTDYGFEGHPLRKDFPLTGHLEIRYDNKKRQIVSEPVNLSQEFRTFDFESPWEGVAAIHQSKRSSS